MNTGTHPLNNFRATDWCRYINNGKIYCKDMNCTFIHPGQVCGDGKWYAMIHNGKRAWLRAKFCDSVEKNEHCNLRDKGDCNHSHSETAEYATYCVKRSCEFAKCEFAHVPIKGVGVAQICRHWQHGIRRCDYRKSERGCYFAHPVDITRALEKGVIYCNLGDKCPGANKCQHAHRKNNDAILATINYMPDEVPARDDDEMDFSAPLTDSNFTAGASGEWVAETTEGKKVEIEFETIVKKKKKAIAAPIPTVPAWNGKNPQIKVDETPVMTVLQRPTDEIEAILLKNYSETIKRIQKDEAAEIAKIKEEFNKQREAATVEHQRVIGDYRVKQARIKAEIDQIRADVAQFVKG